ncbi:MAG: hypothetical protein LBI81_01000 [Puniceicoccales bacterium]|jgi:hypothetical protein|nr:hypothetical protein [Puniceicoccales bacterium]
MSDIIKCNINCSENYDLDGTNFYDLDGRDFAQKACNLKGDAVEDFVTAYVIDGFFDEESISVAMANAYISATGKKTNFNLKMQELELEGNEMTILRNREPNSEEVQECKNLSDKEKNNFAHAYALLRIREMLSEQALLGASYIAGYISGTALGVKTSTFSLYEDAEKYASQYYETYHTYLEEYLEKSISTFGEPSMKEERAVQNGKYVNWVANNALSNNGKTPFELIQF